MPYNVVLALGALGGLALVGTEFVERRELLKAFAGGAVLANLCFCAGPCAEGYLVWIGTRRRATRVVIFVVGMILASLLTLVTILHIAYPPF